MAVRLSALHVEDDTDIIKENTETIITLSLSFPSLRQDANVQYTKTIN
jgi:hypothetical protein